VAKRGPFGYVCRAFMSASRLARAFPRDMMLTTEYGARHGGARGPPGQS